MWHPHWAPRKNIGFSRFRLCLWAPTGKSKDVCQRKLLWHWAQFWTQTSLASNGRKKYLISCLLQHIVIPQPLGNSGRSQKTNERKTTRMNRLFSSSCPTAQISMPVSANMTPSEIWRLVDVNQIKHIHFGHVAICSSTGLIIALVKFRPFTTMSEVKVNQWDELSQFLFHKKRFTDPIVTNGALLGGFMFPIGWRKCSTKNEQFGLYGSVGKIENAKDEWGNQGSNLTLVPTMLKVPYAHVGCQRFTRQSLRLCRLLTIHTSILMLVKVPNNAKNSLCLYSLPTIHMPILRLVKVSHNADNFLCLCSLPTIHTPILMLVKVPENAKNSLRLCRLPTIHTPILILVKVPKNAKNSLRLCRLQTIHTPILTLGKLPNNAKNTLCLCRLATIHTPILTLVNFSNNADNFLCLCRLPTIHMPILTLLKVPNN
ncbi:hypothetical protein O181_111131 [Austropuccinia psidii MF-1]|uniref:Tet-like 2OG-Fe(II) oxygenase domain-containing protein n=1 Tax=Austropuccinia psidii MF-1 TaxID=1389203 RepID=A0A9Q3PSE9_9BASI|nr:hypothetical protein [Austropuccinia psidii MF-1]